MNQIAIALGVLAGLLVLVAIYFLVLRPKCKGPAKPGLFSCYCPAGSTLQKDNVSCSAVPGSPGGPCLPGNKCTDSNESCQGGTCKPCGKTTWGPCCDADPKCQDKDHICIGNTCVPCGVSGQSCCANNSCSDGSRCNLSNMKCCGASGTWCCSSGQPCETPTYECDDSGICVPCGKPQGPCCASDPQCPKDYVCDSGNCVSCGKPQGPCCDSDPQCPKDYVCEKGKCVASHSL
jgi:hypothetical protein